MKLPKTWCITSVGDVCTRLQYGYTASANAEPVLRGFAELTH